MSQQKKQSGMLETDEQQKLKLDHVLARDLMRADVVSFATTTQVVEALRTLEDCHISGAPVVDEMGRVVGVLSVQDLARAAREQEQGFNPKPGEHLSEALQGSPDDEPVVAPFDYDLDLLGRELVRDWMTTSVICVNLDTSLAEICRIMTRQAIHRVLVVDAGNLAGIVTSFDIVRYLAARC